jgi:hypothetical protein
LVWVVVLVVVWSGLVTVVGQVGWSRLWGRRVDAGWCGQVMSVGMDGRTRARIHTYRGWCDV